MSTITDVIDQITTGQIEEGYIPCRDKSNQESIRVMAFNAKNRFQKYIAEEIAISKVKENGVLMVKIYRKPNEGFMVKDENGKLVPYKMPGKLTELERAVAFMKKEGKSEEEIAETIKYWETPEAKTDGESLKKKKRTNLTVSRNSEKEEMQKLAKGERENE